MQDFAQFSAIQALYCPLQYPPFAQEAQAASLSVLVQPPPAHFPQDFAQFSAIHEAYCPDEQIPWAAQLGQLACLSLQFPPVGPFGTSAPSQAFPLIAKSIIFFCKHQKNPLIKILLTLGCRIISTFGMTLGFDNDLHILWK